MHVHARKEIYERKHGPAKAAGARASNVKQGKGKMDANAKSALASFTADTVGKTGRSKRAVQVDAKRATSIPQIAAVVGTSLDKGDELDALAKMPADRQSAVIAKAKAGEKVSAKVELKKHTRAENLHRREITALERAELIEAWAAIRGEQKKTTANKAGQVGQLKKEPGKGRGATGGISEAARDLGMARKSVERAVKVAGLSPEAKEAAKAHGLADNQSALLDAAKAKAPAAQVANTTKKKTAPWEGAVLSRCDVGS